MKRILLSWLCLIGIHKEKKVLPAYMWEETWGCERCPHEWMVCVHTREKKLKGEQQ